MSLELTPNTKSLPISDVKQIRPWVRFWARLIDIYVVNIVTGLLFSIFIPQVLTWGMLAATVITIFFTLLIEALLLSTWGTTLGKSLFQVFVRNSQGKKLSFSRAIKRCVSVWGWGLAFGIPVASLIFSGISYQRIKETGVARWDIEGNSLVSHKKIGIPRIVVIASLVIGLLWIEFILQSAE